MQTVVWGIVKDGKIIPGMPLPEGVCVEIHLLDKPQEFPPELQQELEGWDRASAFTLERFEQQLQDEEGMDAPG